MIHSSTHPLTPITVKEDGGMHHGDKVLDDQQSSEAQPLKDRVHDTWY